MESSMFRRQPGLFCLTVLNWFVHAALQLGILA